MDTLDLIIRLVAATLMGAAIGLDREYRTKAAGFRTHVLVALGSALFMLVSMHGFREAVELYGASFDAARVAAQVVTGIGFIGAGTIIFHKNVVHGLTTAAGLWVTAAIGLACGAGMYVVAGVTTALVLLCLEGFNYFLRRMNRRGQDLKPDERDDSAGEEENT